MSGFGFPEAQPVKLETAAPKQITLSAILALPVRTCGLLMDAALIILFSPVIFVWWLVERNNHRRGL